MEQVEDYEISDAQVNEMEENRIAMLDEAGIDEYEVLQKAREDQNTWQSYFNENLTQAKDDYNFLIRDQWTAIERSEFTRLHRVPMTSNRLPATINKLLGENRKNKPDFIVTALNSNTPQQEIDLRSDILRTICHQSQFDLVKQHVFKSQLCLGFGAFQVDIAYVNPRSFLQEIIYPFIKDPTLTAFDPSACLPHKGDGNWCGRYYPFSREEFDATYPYIINPTSFIDPRNLVDYQWTKQDVIIVSDRWVKEWYPLIIYKLSNGQTVTEDKWEEMQKKFKVIKEIGKDSELSALISKEIPTIVAKRQTQDYKIMQYRCIRDRIIDFNEFPSRHLPLIFADGNSSYIEGRQYTKSFIHDSRDTQKALNYAFSEIMTEMKNRRREQWLVTPDNIQGYDQFWRNPETQNGALVAKPDPKNGMMPQKMPAWDIPQMLLMQADKCSNDIKEITGFFDASLGKEDNAISGKAIMTRQLSGNMADFVYTDNLNQAIEQVGRVTLDLLPSVYGGDERHLMLTNQNGTSKSIILNKMISDGSIENQLTEGDYNVELNVGPSFAIQKSASVELLMELVRINPQVFPLVADLIAKNLDVQFMPQIAERFKTLVPPQIIAEEQGEPPPPPQPDPQEQMHQMQMQLAQQQIQERAAEIKIRQEKHELEKVQLAFDAMKLKDDMHQKKRDNAVDLHGKELDYSAKIAKILADIDTSDKPEKMDKR